MAQAVAVVNATLTATGSGTTDFTSSGFGTPTAAIVIVGDAGSGLNPQASTGLSIGFWDGTSQCVHSIRTFDALATATAFRVSRNDYIAAFAASSTTWSAGYQASAVTDGIRLTMAVDNTSAQRYATVILLKGVSAKIARLTLNSTVSGTATTGSLGFAPTAAVVLGSGLAGNTANSGSTQTTNALLSFGAASSDGTHRMFAWAASTAVSTSAITALYSETRAAAQITSGAEDWSAEVTTWGSDDLTMTSRTAGSGGDDVDILCLGGADLSLLLGTLTTATSTGSVDVATTGVDPDAVLLCLGNTSSTTIASDGTASGISVGVSDGTTHGSYAIVDEDAADTTNAESAYSSTNAVYSRTSASGTASDLVVGAVSMGSELFAVNYTTVSGTARKGWWLAFGPAAGGGSTITADLTESASSSDSTTSTLLAAANLTETASLSDAIAAANQLLANLTESSSLVDVVAAAAIASAAVEEAIAASETQSTSPVLAADLTESASLDDTQSATAVLVVSLSESASAADALSAAAQLVAALAESVTAADTVTAAAQLVTLLTESVAASETVNFATGTTHNVSLTELAAALDVITALLSGAVIEPLEALKLRSIITKSLRAQSRITPRLLLRGALDD